MTIYLKLSKMFVLNDTGLACTQVVGWSKKPEFVMRSSSWICAARSGPGWTSLQIPVFPTIQPPACRLDTGLKHCGIQRNPKMHTETSRKRELENMRKPDMHCAVVAQCTCTRVIRESTGNKNKCCALR